MRLFSINFKQRKNINKRNAIVYSYDNAIYRNDKGDVVTHIGAMSKRELFFRKYFLSNR